MLHDTVFDANGSFQKKRTLSETLSVWLYLSTKCHIWLYMFIVISQRAHLCFLSFIFLPFFLGIQQWHLMIDHLSLVSSFCYSHSYYDYWMVNPCVSIHHWPLTVILFAILLNMILLSFFSYSLLIDCVRLKRLICRKYTQIDAHSDILSVGLCSYCATTGNTTNTNKLKLSHIDKINVNILFGLSQ